MKEPPTMHPVVQEWLNTQRTRVAQQYDQPTTVRERLETLQVADTQPTEQPTETAQPAEAVQPATGTFFTQDLNTNRNRRYYGQFIQNQGRHTDFERGVVNHEDLAARTEAHPTYVDEQGRIRMQRGDRQHAGDPVVEQGHTGQAELRGVAPTAYLIDDADFAPVRGLQIDFHYVERPVLPDPPEGYVERLQEAVAVHEAIAARDVVTTQGEQDTPVQAAEAQEALTVYEVIDMMAQVQTAGAEPTDIVVDLDRYAQATQIAPQEGTDG
jgi:hypothetical protein